MLKCAATRFQLKGDKFDTIMCGFRHAKIREKIHNLHLEVEENSMEDGFLTAGNKFVDRYVAWNIAEHNNQFIHEPEFKKVLYSEDIWDDEE